MANESQLEFCTRMELLDELERRHVAMIFAGQLKNEPGRVFNRCEGSDSACVGLAELLKYSIISMHQKTLEE